MAALSEKAKGKQRAFEPPTAESAAELLPRFRELTVRFTDGIPDLVLSVGEKDVVRDVKLKIRVARQDLAKRRLRLIHAGRLLTDGVTIFDWLLSLEQRQKRALDSHKVDDDSGAPDVNDGPTNTMAWLHCSVGPELADGEDKDEEKAPSPQIKPLRGFDRLTAAGFSQEDIANIRRTFHSQSSSNYLDAELPEDDEDLDEHARALEEQWIDSLDNAGTATISQSSTSSTMLQGLLVGFFFPLLPFFFLREQRPAVFWEDGREHERAGSVVFSKRMQMALVLGFLINVTFGMWRYLLAARLMEGFIQLSSPSPPHFVTRRSDNVRVYLNVVLTIIYSASQIVRPEDTLA